MNQYLQRFGYICEPGLTRLRVETGIDRVGRPQYREVAQCDSEETAAALAQLSERWASLPVVKVRRKGES